MFRPDQYHKEVFETNRIEEETGFKPSQLVEHKLLKVRGRVKGYLKEGNRLILVVQVPDMSDKVSDIPNNWEKISEN